MRYIQVLSIAGSDSSAGAGVQADMKTISALGCYASCVVTSITAQNTIGVYEIENVSAPLVLSQLRCVLEDLQPKVIKIGMVNNSQTIKAIIEGLSNYPYKHLIIDPIIFSTSGKRLLESDAVAVFCNELLPLATLITPNIPETEVLSGMKITQEEDIKRAAERIQSLYHTALLIKGGHWEGETKKDWLFDQHGRLDIFEFPTIYSPNTHGTGCTLSAAISAFLAKGLPLQKAVNEAKIYLSNAIKAGQQVDIGKGNGPLNHFYNPQKLIVR